VSAGLREAGAPSWDRALAHPMVREIAAGTLPHNVFRGYFEQNMLYLQDYARAIALIVSKAPDGDAIGTLARFLRHIVEQEIPANERFFERLGGDAGRPAGAESLRPPAYAYTRHLLAVCAQGDCADGLTAVLPCQWSYGALARPLMAARPADEIYSDWIAMFGNDEYEELVASTTALLDRVADPDDARQMSRLSAIFERSTAYEVGFWDMAYGTPTGGGPSDR
jgi:thiaminase (transcriptional activator TenA)